MGIFDPSSIRPYNLWSINFTKKKNPMILHTCPMLKIDDYAKDGAIRRETSAYA